MSERPLLVLSYSCYKTLVIIFFIDVFIFPERMSIGQISFSPQVPFFLACSCVLIIAAIFFRNRNQFFSHNWYLGFALVCMLVGLLSLFLLNQAELGDPVSQQLCFYLGIGLLAVGFFGVHIEYCRVLGYLGTTQTLAYGVSSSIIGALIYVATLASSEIGQWICTLVLCCVMTGTLIKAKATFDVKALYDQKKEKSLQIPYRFMATSFIQGLGLGCVLGAFGMFALSSDISRSIVAISALTGSAVLTFVTVMIAQLNFNRSIYQVGFPLMAVGLFISGLAIESPMAWILCLITGFLYLDLVLWALGSYLIESCNQPSTWVAACPTMFLMAGRAVGLMSGEYFGAIDLRLFLAVAGFLALFSALMLSSAKNIKTGWGFIRPGKPDTEYDFNEACRSIAQDFSLTPREHDVLKLLASGKTSEEISKALFISQNTAKTHIQSIYNKLGVHSRKKLHSIVEGRKKLFLSPQED